MYCYWRNCMIGLNLGSKGLQIKDSTGKIVFAVRLAGVTVTIEGDTVILQAASINGISAKSVEAGSVQPKTSARSQAENLFTSLNDGHEKHFSEDGNSLPGSNTSLYPISDLMKALNQPITLKVTV